MFCFGLLAAAVLLQGINASPTPRFLRRDTIAQTILPLKQSGRSPASSQALFSKLDTSYAPLISAEGGAGYAVDIGFGSDTFSVIFDTGSSDLWLPQSNFTCVNASKKVLAQSACGFHNTVSSSFEDGQIANENFNISYGDGEFLTGTLGYEDVTLAGITVEKQEVALIDYAYWNGDGLTDGLMGFAYPSLTSAFSGDNPAVDNSNVNSADYQPFIFNAIQQGSVDPVFSMAIERGSNGGGGQLALGGLPNVAFNQTFTSTPLRAIQLNDDDETTSKFSYYTIIPDGFTLGKGAAPSSPASYGTPAPAPIVNSEPMIVDSGTTLMYLPSDLAATINAAFDPPSTLIQSQGVYENSCTAKPPSLSIRIGGTDFQISPEDLLLTDSAGTDKATGKCLVGVQPGSAPYILGDTFMKNVIAVFDIGKAEMRFAPHDY